MTNATSRLFTVLGMGLIFSSALGCSADDVEQEPVDAESESADDENEIASSSEELKATCGYATCTIYLSRGETRRVDENNEFGWVIPTVCAAAGPLAAPCAAALTLRVAQALNQAKKAARENRCLKFKFVQGWATLLDIGTSGNSRYCKGR